ncbi:hypothetical protein, partial [Gordonibacter urolithinfaciens]|uniref:hypothetical protein n=1 Tax=Gordonibacter urolithinfaciens TaxID=1335613 RepID=UPI001952068C
AGSAGVSGVLVLTGRPAGTVITGFRRGMPSPRAAPSEMPFCDEGKRRNTSLAASLCFPICKNAVIAVPMRGLLVE